MVVVPSKKRGEKKLMEKKEPLRLHRVILQKILTAAIFLLAPADDMLGTSRFPIGCMICHLALILESICETSCIETFLPS